MGPTVDPIQNPLTVKKDFGDESKGIGNFVVVFGDECEGSGNVWCSCG